MTRARFDMLAGSCIGAIVTLCIVGGVYLINTFNSPRSGTVSSRCAGASVLVTVAMAPSEAFATVTGQVVVYESPARDWQVNWRGSQRPIAALRHDEGSVTYLHGFAVLGDTDDGRERQVWVRPDGEKIWCKINAGF
jgi:hypothetical protein